MAKWVTLGKVGRTSENGLHLKLMHHTYKIGRTWKYGSHRANWVTFGQMGYTWKNANFVKLKNNGSHLKEMAHTQKYRSQFFKMSHIRQNESKLKNMGHSY